MGIMISIIFMVFGRAIFSLFFTDSSIIEKSDIIIRYIGFIVIFQILQVIYGGSLRSAGDVRYTLFVAIISVTIVRSVATLVMVNLLKLGLDGIWIAILTDQASRFIGLRHRFKQGKWVDLKI